VTQGAASVSASGSAGTVLSKGMGDSPFRPTIGVLGAVLDQEVESRRSCTEVESPVHSLHLRKIPVKI